MYGGKFPNYKLTNPLTPGHWNSRGRRNESCWGSGSNGDVVEENGFLCGGG